jgi:hypothetical protein
VPASDVPSAAEAATVVAVGQPRGGLVGRVATALSPTGRAVALLVCLFVVSRVALVALGFRFEVGLVGSAVQSIDPELLRTRLLQSLWYLHGQPPLWNALVGVSFKLLPQHWAESWHVVFLGLGLVEVLALFALLIELRLPRRAALAIAAAFSLTPAVLAYENSFFYDYPTLVLLTVTALAVARFVSRPTFGRGLLLFGGAACLVLSRTLFQVAWLLAVIALLLIACRRDRRTVFLSCALPLALVLGVFGKNWLMYGVPSTTSWTGMGLARVAVSGVPLSERRRLVSEGKLHSVSLVKPLSPLSDYEAVGIEPDPPTGIPLLDEPSGREFPRNLENRTFIRISRLYWKDDLWIVEHRPGSYLRSVGRGFADFFAPPTRAWGGQGDVGKISSYDRWFNAVVYGRLGPGKDGLFLVAAYVFALLFGLWIAVKRLRPNADAATVTIAFATLTTVYVSLVGNFAEVGENFRFRFVVDPLVVSLVAAGIHRLLRRAQRRGRPPSAEQSKVYV